MKTRISVTATDRNGVRALITVETDSPWHALDADNAAKMDDFQPTDIRRVELADPDTAIDAIARNLSYTILKRRGY